MGLSVNEDPSEQGDAPVLSEVAQLDDTEEPEVHASSKHPESFKDAASNGEHWEWKAEETLQEHDAANEIENETSMAWGAQMGLGVEEQLSCPLNDEGAVLVVSYGSVVDFTGDVIVNAANEECLRGGGVDGAVGQAGGRRLMEARLRLPLVQGSTRVRCPTGDARLTIGGDLPAAHCIHAVGPVYDSIDTMGEKDELLRRAYSSAMQLAQCKDFETIAFSLLSAGEFRGCQSRKRVLEIAVEAIRSSAYPNLKQVHLVAFTEEELEVLLQVCKAAFHV